MTRSVLGIVAACTLLVATPLVAQENRAWPERAFVTFDVPLQPLNNNFSESLTFADTVRKAESVNFVADYASTRGALFDVGAGLRLAKNLGAGVAVSRFQRAGSGSFDLTVPNPIVANKPLDLTGSISGLRRNELGIHFQVLRAFPLGDRARVMLAGGPSVFQIRQDLVRSVQFDIMPGFTALTFDRAFIATAERTVVGFNVSGDITWALARHLGIGTVTRYSRAKATLDPGSQAGVSRAIETHAGGLHVGGGIRVLF